MSSFVPAEYFESFMYIGNNKSFDIDDLRIHNRVLTPYEVVTLKNLPSSCSTVTAGQEHGSLQIEKHVVARYNLLGQKIDTDPTAGTYILLYADSSREKVSVVK